MLEEKLYDDAWQVKSKALAVIEALLKADGCDGYYDYFADNTDPILSLQQSCDKVRYRNR